VSRRALFRQEALDFQLQHKQWGHVALLQPPSTKILTWLAAAAVAGDAPDFVEVGEAGIAMDDAMRRQRRVQLVG
jgi:hypothetical protein